MSVVNESSLAVLAMTNRLLDAGVPALKASEIWRLLEAVEEPSRLLGLDESAIAEITSGTGIESDRLVRLLDSGIGLAVRLDALYERGIIALTVVDETYPIRLRERLGPAAPPVLYCSGNVTLLGVDGIGMVGSRDVGPEGVEITREVAHGVARAGLPAVSGGARGVDKISMAAAYEAGGTVVGVLADSLEKAIGVRENRAAMLEGRSCFCTPYRPDARFTVGTAMGRNKIIYGLSQVTLVVASAKGEGGTWSGATEALKKGYGRVAVWMGDGGGPGNAPLVKAGAVPIEQPDEIFALAPIEPGESPLDSQMALSFESSEQADRVLESSIPKAPAPEDQRASQQVDAEQRSASLATEVKALPADVVPVQATGMCWCGCGKATKDGAFFLPRHAPGAAQRAAVKHFGSVEQFLVAFNEVPSD